MWTRIYNQAEELFLPLERVRTRMGAVRWEASTCIPAAPSWSSQPMPSSLLPTIYLPDKLKTLLGFVLLDSHSQDKTYFGIASVSPLCCSVTDAYNLLFTLNSVVHYLLITLIRVPYQSNYTCSWCGSAGSFEKSGE